MAIRFDRIGHLKKPERTAAGFLRSDAFVTRIGVFRYLNADGSIRRELRLPEEVFSPESLATLDLVPVTREHPPTLVTDDNARDYQVGTTGQGAEQNDRFVKTTVQITDRETINDVDSNKRRDLSCGYTCDKEMTPGVTKGIQGVRDGVKYDLIQRNIRYNHVATTTHGRAGPEVAIPRFDSMDDDIAFMVTDSVDDKRKSKPTTGASKMETIRIDGVDHEVSKQTAQAFAKYVADGRTEKESLQKALDKEKARADAAEDALKAEKKKVEDTEAKLKEATDPKAVQDAVEARVKLVSDAMTVLRAHEADKDKDGKEINIAVMTDSEIRLTAIKGACSEFNADGHSDEYLKCRFDLAVEAAQDKSAANQDAEGKARQSRHDVQRAAAAGAEKEMNADAARQKRMDEDEAAWQKPLTIGESRA